jgi:hypothetical protein
MSWLKAITRKAKATARARQGLPGLAVELRDPTLQELKPKNKKQAGYLTSGRGSVTARACAAKTGYATGGAGEIVEKISRRAPGGDGVIGPPSFPYI